MRPAISFAWDLVRSWRALRLGESFGERFSGGEGVGISLGHRIVQGGVSYVELIVKDWD